MEVLNFDKFNVVNGELNNICGKCCLESHRKKCITCEEIKDFADYYERKSNNTLRGSCKQCVRNTKKKWKSNNVEHSKKTDKAYREREEVKEHSREYQREYYGKPENRERKNAIARVNETWRRKNDTQYYLSKKIISRMNRISDSGETCETFTILGCTKAHFMKWMEYQFDPNMNWGNHGLYWQFDHIKPISSFNLLDEEEFRLCANWKNVQPLTVQANAEKRAKYNDEIRIKADETLMAFIAEFEIMDFLDI
jgi:hypothetical protein